MSICTLVAILAGCGSSEPSEGEASSADPKYTIAVVPKGLGHQFWVTVHEGAKAAGADLDAEILWKGPDKETQIAKQIYIIEDMISRGVDAVVMAACDENALVDTIKKAMDSGIPVITIDSGVQSDLPVSFIATDNIAGAKAAGRKLAELIGEEGEVGLIPFIAGAATSEMRETGFKQAIAEYDDIKLVATIYCQSDVSKAMQAAEDMMTANRNLKGIFAANEAAAIGAAKALEIANKSGEIMLVAFDASPEEIAALERGTIQALIVQDPFKMGYEGVRKAVDHIEGRPVEKRIDTGVVVVTKDNLHDDAIQELLNP